MRRPTTAAAVTSILLACGAPPAWSAAPPARAPAGELEIVTVIGDASRAAVLPGAHQAIDAGTLEEMHVMTTSEALRKAVGVNVRDEEGFGLRPNIGVRGLNPTRSTKVLLLEDGIPLAYAPYGDNASYYHPPIDRFARVEVLKGAAMNQYGPQTLGGVVNYITPTPPDAFEGFLRFTAGNRDYVNTHARAGGHGLQIDVVDKRGDGARDHIDSTLQDYNAKWRSELAPAHTLVLRANHYAEDSALTYSGLTEAELAAFGHRYNPFHNDEFDTRRTGFSATHVWRAGAGVDLTTSVYFSEFARDWWRQASTTTDSQCNAVTYTVGGQPRNFAQARAAGFAVDADDCNSRQGRLRSYTSRGIAPRLDVAHGLFGAEGELTVGARFHTETQRRRQENAASATGSDGVLVERNRRNTDAWSAYVQDRFTLDRLDLVPGLRVEHIDNERENRLTGARGDADATEWLPSLGVSFRATPSTTLFAGIHRGFAPARTEDLIDNAGTVTDVDAEASVNVELGLRSRLGDAVSIDATLFRSDFSNQVAVGSIAGGNTPLAEGEALYEGVELGAQASRDALFGWAWTPYARLAWTYVPTADIDGDFVRVDNGTVVPGAVDGNRLPYAPEHLVTASAGARLPGGFDVHLELVHVDQQFADFANTRSAPAGGNGQVGRIDAYTIWNAAVNWRAPSLPLTLFAAVKNLGDDAYIVDRTRGIQAAAPRLLQAGVEVRF
jgi:Fe(3+) dicitrate transport protein